MGSRPFQLGEFGLRGAADVLHSNGLARLGGVEGGVEGDVADVAAGDVETGQPVVVQAVARGVVGEDPPPDLGALGGLGERELDHEPDPAQECGVEVVLLVGRQDRQTPVALHPLEQVADLDVGVAVVAVLELGALAEEGVGLVEEEDARPPPRRRRRRASGSSRSRRCTC